MYVCENDLNFLFCSDVADYHLHDVSILGIVLPVGCSSAFAHMILKLFLSFLFLHHESCVFLSAEFDLKSIDDAVGMDWKDILDVEGVLVGIEICLCECDLCEAVDYFDVIVEIFEWELEWGVVGLEEGVAAGHGSVLLLVLVKGHYL